MGPERYSYKKFIKAVHNEYEQREDVYPVVYPQLDRIPRAGKDAVILTGSTPKLFKQYLLDTLEIIKKKPEENRFLIINAWNEWGEGTYLEPDEKYGYANINTLSKVICKK